MGDWPMSHSRLPRFNVHTFTEWPKTHMITGKNGVNVEKIYSNYISFKNYWEVLNIGFDQKIRTLRDIHDLKDPAPGHITYPSVRRPSVITSPLPPPEWRWFSMQPIGSDQQSRSGPMPVRPRPPFPGFRKVP